MRSIKENTSLVTDFDWIVFIASVLRSTSWRLDNQLRGNFPCVRWGAWSRSVFDNDWRAKCGGNRWASYSFWVRLLEELLDRVWVPFLTIEPRIVVNLRATGGFRWGMRWWWWRSVGMTTILGIEWVFARDIWSRVVGRHCGHRLWEINDAFGRRWRCRKKTAKAVAWKIWLETFLCWPWVWIEKWRVPNPMFR